MQSRITTGKPLRAFYKQVQNGDIRKFYNQSNDSPSGGGARDLRISPVNDFWEPLKIFFPIEISTRERRGLIYTKRETAVESVSITLMGPTKARSNECRICTISQIEGWRITEEEFNVKKNAGYEWFFLLILDDKSQVWASKFCTENIDRMSVRIREEIKQALATRSRIAMRGICSLE